MRKLIHTAMAILAMMTTMTATAQKYAGGDISMLTTYENAGSTYLDYNGQKVQALDFFKEQGHNAMRVRLFVNPDDYTASDKDANASQTLDYVKALGKRIKDAGFKLLLDFHYSDTWADPAKQWTPKAWASLTDAQLEQQLYAYTKECLEAMVEAGATPDFIQTGNEISYGMLWGAYGASESSLKRCYTNSPAANWTRFTSLLSQAIKACREVTPKAKVVLHSERVPQPAVLTDFLTRMKNASVDYDIIGLSYYPYFHGPLSNLETAINRASTYDKEIMLVEVGYPFNDWNMGSDSYNTSSTYAYSSDGQNQFATDLIAMLNKHDNVTGLFWWWMDMNAYPYNTTKVEGWYRSAVFWSDSGWPTNTIKTIGTFADNTAGIDGVAAPTVSASSRRWFTLGGQQIARPAKSGIYVNGGKKVVVK